eukprot:1161083-Pelagomonas_calceolata.AAC.8
MLPAKARPKFGWSSLVAKCSLFSLVSQASCLAEVVGSSAAKQQTVRWHSSVPLQVRLGSGAQQQACTSTHSVQNVQDHSSKLAEQFLAMRSWQREGAAKVALP